MGNEQLALVDTAEPKLESKLESKKPRPKPTSLDSVLRARFTASERAMIVAAAAHDANTVPGTWARGVIRAAIRGGRPSTPAYYKAVGLQFDPATKATESVSFRLPLQREENERLIDLQDGLPRTLWARRVLCDEAARQLCKMPEGQVQCSREGCTKPQVEGSKYCSQKCRVQNARAAAKARKEAAEIVAAAAALEAENVAAAATPG